MLSSHCRQLKFEKKVYVLTDATSLMNSEDMAALVLQTNSMGVLFSLIGFDFDSTCSELKESNKKVLRAFLDEVDGNFFHSKTAMEMMGSLRTKSIKSTTTFRGNMVLGTLDAQETLSFPIWIYNKTSELKIPTSKKFSNLVTLSSHDKEDVDPITYGQVEIRRSYQAIPKGDTMDEISILDRPELDADDIGIAFQYGKTNVILSEQDQGQGQLDTQKSVLLLGFVPLSLVARDQCMGRILAIVPDPGAPRFSFDAFMAALYDKNVAAIARYVRTAGSTPQMGAIICNKKGYGYFMPMPYSNDARNLTFGKLDSLMDLSNSLEFTKARKKQKLDTLGTCSKEAFKVIDELIDQMHVPKVSDSVDAFNPKLILNPTYQRLYQCIIHRIMHPNEPVPPMDPRIVNGLRPLSNVNDIKTKATLEHLHSMFNLKSS